MKSNILSSTPVGRTFPLFAFLLFSAGLCWGQTQATASGAATASDFAVAQRGPHSRLWQNSAGQSVTEMMTGMHYWDGQQWTASDPSFVVSPDGTAFVAAHLQDPTQLAANLNCVGAVTVTTPDNVTLRSTPVAIGLYDAASGKSVIVATLTNTTGALAGPQHVVYSKAFVGGGFSASVVYSLPDTGSFHQDVVFTGFNQPFDPTVWGFAAASTNSLQLQIFTEFYDPPQPVRLTNLVYVEKNQATRDSMASPDLIDYTLDFGHYVFGPGWAYTTATNAGPAAGSLKAPPSHDLSRSGVPILKDFVTSEGRVFLVESIPWRWLAGQLKALPPVVAKNTPLQRQPGAKKTRVAAVSVPPLRTIKTAEMEKVVPAKTSALAVAPPRGVTADYVATVSSTSEAIVFSADTTYFVSGNIYITGPMTLESAVFKFPLDSGIMWISTVPTINTTNYRPAIFTAADDNTAGTTLSTSIWSGYTGNPGNNLYAQTPLWLDGVNSAALNNLQFRYAYGGIGFGYGSADQVITVTDCQFVDCSTSVTLELYYPSTLNLNNCLMGHVTYQVDSQYQPVTVNAWNCTFDQAIYMFWADPSGYSGTDSYSFTNCIFSNITNEFVMDGAASSVSNGAYNGFYNAATFGSASISNSTSPYQSVGAGNYYLPSESSFLAAGITNGMSAALLSQLQAATTFPPLLLTNYLNVNTVLCPQAQRDTAGTDLGYHYDPIDYIAACSVSNATLLLTNGVALAYYDNTGIWLQDGSQLVSQGTPNQRNYLVYYGLVQEQPLSLSTNPIAQSLPIAASPYGSSSNPSIFLRLTTVCAPQGETNLLNTADFGVTGQTISGLTLRDCEVYGAGANWLMSESANEPSIGFTNNVFHRIPFVISNSSAIMSFNNLFYGTTNVPANTVTVSIRNRSGTSPNTNQNNAFDGVKVTLDGTVGYNAYLNGATNGTAATTNSTDIWTTLTWLPSTLGSYYQATNGPLLTNGSTYATNLGLYHYTVTTNNLVEGTNIVSRGYHYVACGANGLPLDTSGNGPDYLLDANGNGIVDSGEISWTSAGDLGLTVIITQPANNTTIP